MSRDFRGRSNPLTERFRHYLRPSGRTICCSSPPTTETIPPRRQRITRASVCRCSWPGRACVGALGVRDTFSDLGATVADWFGQAWRGRGTSFLPELLRA